MARGMYSIERMLMTRWNDSGQTYFPKRDPELLAVIVQNEEEREAFDDMVEQGFIGLDSEDDYYVTGAGEDAFRAAGGRLENAAQL